MSTAIEVRGLRKRFGAVAAVDGVDLEVASGEFTVLLGPSGCGKSTLLRLIAGFEAPDAGEIRLGGDAVAAPADGVLVPPERRGVGIVFQQLALFPHLDVRGNIGYGLRRLPRDERRARVEEMLALIDLTSTATRYPDQLSGGQAQRVALARALAPSPAVVLLDEPFSSLDTALRSSLRAEVRAILKDAGVTSVLVTHDQDEALSMGDRVAVMFDGRIARHGDPREVYLAPGSPPVAAFVGEANVLPGQVRDGILVTELGELPCDAGDGDVTATFRPEHVQLEPADGGGAVIVAVEYYGHDQAVRLRLPSGREVRARIGTEHLVAPGQRVRASATGFVSVTAP